MEVLAEAIVSLFPEEKLTTWYISPKAFEHKRISGGKLPERLRNVWRNLGDIRECKRQEKVSTTVEDGSDDEDLLDDLNWLKFNSQPWTEVTNRWTRTSGYRVRKFTDGSKSIKSFKLLFDPKSDELINIDFLTLCSWKCFGECNQKLFQLWPQITPKLLSVANTKTTEDNAPESQAFLALVNLTCAKQRVRLGPDAPRKFFVPTLQDSRNSFLMHAQTLDEADKKLQELRNQYAALPLKVQPLVMQIGESATVVYDLWRWTFDNAVKAIDVCFKLIQILNLEYSHASRPAWTFLQQYVYGIHTGYDHSSPAADGLASQLQL